MQARKVTVLNGSIAAQLTSHVKVTDGHPLWVSGFLHTNPSAVVQTHLDFLRAGSDALVTNTYQASVQGFMDHLGLDEEHSLKLFATAVKLANQAIDIYASETGKNYEGKNRPLIIGSAGPYGSSLRDFSEYTGDYVDRVTKETMRDWHRPKLRALLDAGADILALETIPAQAEAEMLAELMKEFPGKKAWLSFSCKDGNHTSHGEIFREAAVHCWKLNPEQIVAVGANCLNSKLVASLFRDINKDRKSNPIPLVTYPNSGEKYDKNKGWVEKCEPIETYVKEWLDLGVVYVGGCCRTNHTDVTKIRAEVDKWIASQK